MCALTMMLSPQKSGITLAMKRLMNSLIPASLMAMAISACGGGPDVDQVKADFENPSGSTKDKNGVIAASGKQGTTSNSALGVAGGGVPGLGLTADGKSTIFNKIAPRAVFGSKIANIAAVAMKRSDLRVAQAETTCFDGSEFAEASAELQAAAVKGEKASVSVSTSVDLGNCSADASGSLDLSMEMTVDGAKISYEVEYTFNNVCDKSSGECLDGGMAQEAAIDLSAADMENLFGSIKSVSAWDFTATDGEGNSIHTKGGLRIGFSSDAMGDSAKIEYLLYVADSSGNEVSYVLTIEANGATGELTLAIKGSDGELNCSFSEATGSGMCSGTDSSGASFEMSWTDGEYDAVTSSEDYRG